MSDDDVPEDGEDRENGEDAADMRPGQQNLEAATPTMVAQPWSRL